MPPQLRIAPADSRDRIVRAALDLFCARGYAAVGTAELCERAGVLKGTLYHFFATKLDIALAALDAYGASLEADFGRIARGAAPAETRLLELFANARRAAKRAQKADGAVTGCLHGNLAQELSATDPAVRDALMGVADRWVAALRPLFTELAPADPDRAAAAVLAYLHGAVLMAKAANDPAVIDRLAPAAVAIARSVGPA